MQIVRTHPSLKPWLQLTLISFLALWLSGCGYNDLQRLDEDVDAKWSEVVNQYQRRADLVPNLVETVKGYAEHEQEVFTQVTEARAKVSNITLTADALNDPQAMAKFQQAQSQLTSALSRLLAVAENYPDLKANTTFENLMAQLEGTENRISVARNRYIEAVRTYNVKVREFPTNITAKVFGMHAKENFSVENEEEISQAPDVSFD